MRRVKKEGKFPLSIQLPSSNSFYVRFVQKLNKAETKNTFTKKSQSFF